MEDLLAAGFRLNAPAPPDLAPAAPAGAADDDGQEEREDVAALRAALERERLEHRVALAEERHGRERGLRARVEAQERHISSLEDSLRALLPGPERAAVEAPVGRRCRRSRRRGSVEVSAAVPRPSAQSAEPGTSGQERRWWWRRP
ncbi:hypothetical protein [Streptomyces roseolilacinus]|uniref:hypothetical protein n=1 Tax=Streptomyces roseolilacinus TaxID=66904 RepID=UPI00382BECFC